MTETQHIAELAEKIVATIEEVEALNPDRNELMRKYWLESYEYPRAVATMREISQSVCRLNPTMLDAADVQRRLILFVVRAVLAFDFDPADRLAEARREVHWLSSFTERHELHVQLVNLFLRNPVPFGHVEIHPIPNTGDTTEYELKYRGPLGHGGPVDAVLSYAVVPQAPGLEVKALRNAVETVDRALLLLRAIGLPTLWGRELRQANIAGRGVGSGWVVLRRAHRRPWDTSLAASPILSYMDLDDMLRNYTSDEITQVGQLSQLDNASRIEWKLLQALLWLGEATLPATNSSKFARLAIAFETAVGGEARRHTEIGVTEMLAERTAFLLGSTVSSRLSWHESVRRLYGLRSKVMHGDAEPIGDDDLARWAFLVWAAVRAMLNRRSQFRNVEELVKWVRIQRYSVLI